MQSTESQVLYSEADQLLRAADMEINRAEEDAVTHLICHNSRQSIVNYLKGYLLLRGAEPIEPVTMAGLLKQCSKIDTRFKDLDFSQIQCRFESQDKDYCLDLETVGECFRIARKTEELVKQ